MKKTVQIEYREDIALVILNRPNKKNAMSITMMQELIATAAEIKKNKSIRAVILMGSQQTFCSGIDLEDLNQNNHKLKIMWELIKPGHSIFQKAALVWRELPIPVIAVLEGYCLGAGMQLALAADFRFAHPETQFAILEARWGIVPDMGFSRSTQYLIPQDILRKYVYTGQFFNAQEALQYHCVTHVSEHALEDALNLIKELTVRSPDMLAGSKDIINQLERNPKKALRMEKTWQIKLLMGKNQKIAVKNNKNTEKKPYHPRQYS